MARQQRRTRGNGLAGGVAWRGGGQGRDLCRAKARIQLLSFKTAPHLRLKGFMILYVVVSFQGSKY